MMELEIVILMHKENWLQLQLAKVEQNRHQAIAVARIFDWGWRGKSKPQITRDVVIKNFRKKNKLFVGQTYCRLQDQKPWAVCLHLTRILLQGENLTKNKKCKCVNWETC